MITAEDFRERAIPNPTEQHLTLVVFITFVLFAVVSLDGSARNRLMSTIMR